MALSFAEWDKQGQPQQPAGSSASAPSFQQWSQGQGAPSFQQWSQNPQASAAKNYGGGYNGYTAQEMRWLLQNAGAAGNEVTKEQLDDPTFQAMVKRGAISVGDPYDVTLGAYSNESGIDPGHVEQRYNVKPTFELPKVMEGYGGRGYGYTLAYDPEHGYDSGSVEFGDGGKSVAPSNLQYDPVYGAVSHFQTKHDIMDKLAPMLAMGMAMGPIAGTLGPMLGNALGLPAGLGSAAIKAVPGLLMSGGKSLGSTAASFLGSATGLPMGGQLGSLAYNAAIGNRIDPARTGLSMAPSFVSWLANHGG